MVKKVSSVLSSDAIQALAPDSSVPIYQHLKQMIIRQIETGVWPPHHRVPSENALVEQLGASRMTYNRALRELTAERRLVRKRGVGTFVTEPKSHSPLLAINKRHKPVHQRRLRLQWMHTPND